MHIPIVCLFDDGNTLDEQHEGTASPRVEQGRCTGYPGDGQGAAQRDDACLPLARAISSNSFDRNR